MSIEIIANLLGNYFHSPVISGAGYESTHHFGLGSPKTLSNKSVTKL